MHGDERLEGSGLRLVHREVAHARRGVDRDAAPVHDHELHAVGRQELLEQTEEPAEVLRGGERTGQGTARFVEITHLVSFADALDPPAVRREREPDRRDHQDQRDGLGGPQDRAEDAERHVADPMHHVHRQRKPEQIEEPRALDHRHHEHDRGGVHRERDVHRGEDARAQSTGSVGPVPIRPRIENAISARVIPIRNCETL